MLTKKLASLFPTGHPCGQVCTVEAVYFLLQQMCQGRSGKHQEGETCHCYDNL